MFFQVHNVENFELLKNSLFSRTLVIKISEYQISIGVRPRLTGFQLIGELFLDVVNPNTDNRGPTVLFFLSGA